MGQLHSPKDYQTVTMNSTANKYYHLQKYVSAFVPYIRKYAKNFLESLNQTE